MTVILCAVALAGLCWAAPNAGADSPRQHAAVAENPRATREALRQLQQGGNAADAAVTAALVAGVVSPTSSGIGGGCFINYFDPAVHNAQTGPWILDARETAPAGLIEQDFDGKGFAFEARGKWVGTPGEVAGLYELHRRFGKRTWSQVVMPAVRAAEQGFEVSPHLAKLTQLTQKSFAGDPSLNRLWLSPLKNAGSWASTPRLGATLRKLAQQGP
jgi:gamma-glutamyltranspeptidase / glutathione hydrolase